MSIFLPSWSPCVPSDARHFPVSFVTWLDRDEPLPIPMDTEIDTGPEGTLEGSRTWASPSSRADQMETLLARIMPLINVVF